MASKRKLIVIYDVEHDHLEVGWNDPEETAPYISAGDMDVAVDKKTGKVVGFQVFNVSAKAKEGLFVRDVPLTRKEVETQYEQGKTMADVLKEQKRSRRKIA